VAARGRTGLLYEHASLFTLPPSARSDPDGHWFDGAVEALAFAITSATALLELEAVVIDGALSPPIVRSLCDRTRAALERTMPPDVFTPEVLEGTLGVAAASIGAGMLPLNATFAPDISALLKRG